MYRSEVTQPRVLIVGARGDIGSEFYKCWGDRAAYSDRNNEQEDKRLDLAQPADWSNFLRGVNYCLIAAGCSRPNECLLDPVGTDMINVIGTAHLVEQCAKLGVIPIFFSSEQVYGPLEGIANEYTRTMATSVYAQQKLAIENKIRELCEVHIILRISRVEYSSTKKSSLISDCASKLLSGVYCFASDQIVNLLHIDDLVYIVEQLVAKRACGTFNVAGSEYMSRSTLATLILNHLRRDPRSSLRETIIQPVELRRFIVSEPRATLLLIDSRKLRSFMNGFLPRSVSSILSMYDFGALNIDVPVQATR